MGRANVQVVSTRAGLHSLAHRYGRTISVFTKVSSSDRIILNQYSIRGDALWYALPPAAARGCEFWQPSRIPSWPERFSTPSACHPGLLPWLRLAATHTPNSPNSDGAPAAFANVCFQAAWFRPCSTNRPVQILVQPGQLLFR